MFQKRVSLRLAATIISMTAGFSGAAYADALIAAQLTGSQPSKWEKANLGMTPTAAAHDAKTGNLRLWGIKGSRTTDASTVSTTFDAGKSSVVGTTDGEFPVFGQGLAIDRDGNVIVAGGATDGGTFSWPAGAASMQKFGNLKNPRSYNSLVALANGDVLAYGGYAYGDVEDAASRFAEVLRGTTWTKLDRVSSENLGTEDRIKQWRRANMWLFATRRALAFLAGPSTNMAWIQTYDTAASTRSAGMRNGNHAMNGIAVMYAPDKILTVGGAANSASGDATDRAQIVDIKSGYNTQVAVEAIKSANNPRVFGNGVLLPNGKVLIVGGQSSADKPGAGKSVDKMEVFDPATKTFTDEDKALPSRRKYLSVAMLLPDGRVFVAGTGFSTSADIYSPGYLFKSDGMPATRPELTRVPEGARAGAKISVKSNGAKFALVRMSSTTRGVNTDQRRLEVQATREDPKNEDGFQTLILPTTEEGVIPGYYMLFALSDTGTPSKAGIIRLR